MLPNGDLFDYFTILTTFFLINLGSCFFIFYANKKTLDEKQIWKSGHQTSKYISWTCLPDVGNLFLYLLLTKYCLFIATFSCLADVRLHWIGFKYDSYLQGLFLFFILKKDMQYWNKKKDVIRICHVVCFGWPLAPRTNICSDRIYWWDKIWLSPSLSLSINLSINFDD